MKHEGSLQCSQQPANGPYPEPNESSHTLTPYVQTLNIPPWNTVIEKLIVIQLVMKSHPFYGTRRFIAVFAEARSEPVESNPQSHTIFKFTRTHKYKSN
jgi:hypothetical protein